jgi:hypothetical protein
MKTTFYLALILILSSCSSPAQKDTVDKKMEEILLLDKNDFNPYVEFYSTDIKDYFNPESSGKYPSTNLFDGYLKTCWIAGNTGKKSKSGLFIKVPGNIPIDKLIFNIFPGYGKSNALYLKNARPQRIRLTIYAAFYPEGCSTEVANLYLIKKYSDTHYIDILDSFGVQSFPLNIDKAEFADFQRNSLEDCQFFSGDSYDKLKPDTDTVIFTPATIIKLEVEAVYPGSKYDDICISEMFFNDRFVTHYPDRYNQVDTVYIKDDNILTADYAVEKSIVIVKDTSSVFIDIYHPEHLNWAVLSYVPKDESGEGSRTEEHYSLIDLKNRKVIDNTIFKKCTGSFLSSPLIEKDGSGKIVLDIYEDFEVELK